MRHIGILHAQALTIPQPRPEPDPLPNRAIRVFLVVLLAFVSLAEPWGATRDTPVARAATLPAYRIEAALDLDAGRLAARQVVAFTNRTGQPLESVVFRVVPNVVGRFALDASLVDGQPRQARIEGSVLELSLAGPLAPEATATIELGYAIALPRQQGRLTATSRGVTLGNWAPLLAVWRGDWDRRQYVDVGDAFYSEVADYDVTLTTNRPAIVAGTGRLVEQDGTRWRFEGSGVRDFALAASPAYAAQTMEIDGTSVTGYAFSPSRARLYAERGAEFVRWFGARLGPYPYPNLAIVDGDLPASYGGMEYPGLVLISAQINAPVPIDGSTLDVLLAHEIAHQWFYSWVGNDQLADPWLDEAFAQYLPTLYYADVRPDLYQGVLDRSTARGTAGRPVDSTVYDFPDDGPYFGVVYRRGARFLHALRGRLGDAQFLALLHEHIATHRDRLATPRAFLDLAQSATTANLNPLFAEYFSYAAFRYPTPQAWTLEIPAIPWAGSVQLFVGADFPVAWLELWLDGRLLADGPENAVTIDLTGVEPGEYVLLARVTDHQGAVFERSRRVAVGD